jgi:hypothetical protein
VGGCAGSAIAHTRQRVAVLRRLGELAPQRLDLKAHAVDQVVELVKVADRDRQLVGTPLQDACGAPVHLLVRLAERGERDVIAQQRGAVAVVPLAKTTTVVRTGFQVGCIGR